MLTNEKGYPEYHVHAFLDEYGQLERPGQKALGVLFVPAPVGNDAPFKRITQLVNPIRSRVAQLRADGKPPKAQEWNTQEALNFASVVRNERWIVGTPTLDTRTAHWQEEWQGEKADDAIRKAADHFREVHPESARHAEEMVRVFNTFPAYVNLVWNMIAGFGDFFLNKKKHWLLSFHLTVDDHVERDIVETLRFLCCIPFSPTFEHLAADSLSEPHERKLVTVTVQSDKNVDGLILADALSYWNGERFRGRDSEGEFRRYFNIMNILK